MKLNLSHISSRRPLLIYIISTNSWFFPKLVYHYAHSYVTAICYQRSSNAQWSGHKLSTVASNSAKPYNTTSSHTAGITHEHTAVACQIRKLVRGHNDSAQTSRVSSGRSDSSVHKLPICANTAPVYQHPQTFYNSLSWYKNTADSPRLFTRRIRAM